MSDKTAQGMSEQPDQMLAVSPPNNSLAINIERELMSARSAIYQQINLSAQDERDWFRRLDQIIVDWQSINNHRQSHPTQVTANIQGVIHGTPECNHAREKIEPVARKRFHSQKRPYSQEVMAWVISCCIAGSVLLLMIGKAPQ